MHRLITIAITLLLLPATCAAESSLIDVTQYRAMVRFHIAQKQLEGDAYVTLRNVARGDLTEIDLDLTAMTIAAVEVEGVTAVYRYDDRLLTVELPAPLTPNDTITVRIQYNGSPGNEGGLLPWGGCHWGDVTYFMGVGFLAESVSLMRNWLPSNDIPSDKARFDVTFEVPEGLVTAGTGVLAERSATGDGFTAFRWVESHPTATYLFTYAISDYAIVQDEWNGIPMVYYVPRADSARAVGFFSTVPSMMDAFTSRFGAYPFDKVGYCVTPIGSMEHQTMISYAAQLFNGREHAGITAAHELAHMWWGDMVTCRDFRDAWLNEGFAVFSEMLYTEHLDGEEAYLEYVRETAQQYRVNDARNEGVFPLFDFPRRLPSSNYPGTIYHKGGVVMAMLRDVMGDEAFFDGLRAYGQRHAYDNATSQDLEDVMEEYHGAQLDWFFDQWVYAPGWPEYVVERVYDNDANPLRLILRQEQDTTQYPLFAMPMDVMIATTSGDTVRHRIETEALSSQEFRFNDVAANSIRNVVLDPRGIILKKINHRIVDVEALDHALPGTPRLDAAYPNPWQPATDGTLVVPVTTPVAGHLSVAVHDMLGRRLLTLHDGELGIGRHALRVNPGRLTAGIYMIVLRTSGSSQWQRFIVN
ncbi:MAG: T9SS type A sorting domain-containing protein [Bacteroidetes bacterium]|nr:T9SS type A sorting domain-containing protein [Bacteroidota bacterium]